MTNIKHYFDGRTYTAIKDATISYDSYTDLHKFTAHAICDTDTVNADGFVEISSNGSHRKLYNAQTNKTTIVTYRSQTLKIGTERNILKLAGLKK